MNDEDFKNNIFSLMSSKHDYNIESVKFDWTFGSILELIIILVF